MDSDIFKMDIEKYQSYDNIMVALTNFHLGNNPLRDEEHRAYRNVFEIEQRRSKLPKKGSERATENTEKSAIEI